MNIHINKEEYQLLIEAREKREWKSLPIWKLKFLYQKFIALPSNDLQTVKDIGNLAAQALGKPASGQSTDIFGVHRNE